jgi:hypothetical protein
VERVSQAIEEVAFAAMPGNPMLRHVNRNAGSDSSAAPILPGRDKNISIPSENPTDRPQLRDRLIFGR